MSHYVKFAYEGARPDIAPFDALAELNACRRKLLELRLIGVDSNGVGFGNLSVRDGVSGNFYVTGSATAGHEGGIVAFGKNLQNAFDVLMCARELAQPCDAGRQYAGHSGQNARAPRQRAD